MKRIACFLFSLFALAALPAIAAKSDPVAEVTKFEMHMQDVYNSEEFIKDPKMALVYWEGGDDVHLFDVMQPGEFAGEAFRKHFIEVGGQFIGKVEFLNMKVHANDGMAFVSMTQHFVGKDKAGHPFDMTLLVTDGLKKTKGKWLVVHEHVSMALDDATFMSMFTKKK
jgi:ketosteroid isomerase-like protein